MTKKALPEVYTKIKRVKKAWGYEDWLWNEEYCVKRIHILGNHATSWHYHELKDEIFTVLHGGLKVLMSWNDVEYEGEYHSVIVLCGESLHIPRGLRHRLVAYDGPVTLIEGSTHHEDSNSIRIKGGY